jgi:hypothetical protein
MSTALADYDYDALVRPIENARDARSARAAFRAAVGFVKTDYKQWGRVQAIDAAGWVAGLSQEFRGDVITKTLNHSRWGFPANLPYPPIPDEVPVGRLAG